jgi:NitT/TauT family transport system ATP-binding protein
MVVANRPLTKHYWLEREKPRRPAFRRSVNDGEFMPSLVRRLWKTSMLNIAAGLLPYEEGVVAIDGKKIADRARSRRRVSAFRAFAVAHHRRERPSGMEL